MRRASIVAIGEGSGREHWPAENVYGHRRRLEWIDSYCFPGARILEIGCGTGYMVTIPLLEVGRDAIGVDLDVASIEYGRELLREKGMDPGRLCAARAEDLSEKFNVVILSEVLEHVPDDQLDKIIVAARDALAPGGIMLVTVPNGFGAFEVEDFLWSKMGIGAAIRGLRVEYCVERLKQRFLGSAFVFEHPSTLSSSPHVQRFTLGRIVRLLRSQHLEPVSATGTVLVAGPLSNLAFTGVGWIMGLNMWLAGRFPRAAAGFLVALIRSSDSQGQDAE